MGNSRAGRVRPQIHLLASESDLVASLALRTEDRNPVVAAMLLEEIERAELHEPATLPKDAVRLGSQVHFVDDKTCQLRKVRIVIPGEANIAENRISILTPMGAALYGLRAGSSIIWPDLDGNERRITIVRVLQRGGDGPAPRGH
jgi:regulator of nucleoside diphosphate kinase